MTSAESLSCVWASLRLARKRDGIPIAMVGYLGVSFFFVLSGFILVYTYADRVVSLREFWQLRFARIYPAFLFSLLLTAPAFAEIEMVTAPTDPAKPPTTATAGASPRWPSRGWARAARPR